MKENNMEYIQELISGLIKHWDIVAGLLVVLRLVFTLYNLYRWHGYRLGYLETKSLPLLINYRIRDDLRITYKDKPITRLEGKTFRIFNYGDKEIRKEDLYENKLSVEAINGKILDITVKTKEEDGSIKLKKINDTKYNILFNYINVSQIIDVNILYDAEDVSINCKAAGMGNICKFSERIKPTGFITLFFVFIFAISLSYVYYTKGWTSFIYPLASITFLLLSLLTLYIYISQVYAFWIGPKQKIIDYKFPDADD